MDLGGALGMAVATGDTTGARDDFAPECGSAEGAPDVIYTWTAPADGLYVFDLRGSTYDTELILLAGGCGGAALDCNDDFFDLQSRLQRMMTAGETVAIVIDGYADSFGAYTLNIGTAAPEDCSNGTDDDLDDAIDCADFDDCDALPMCHETGAQCTDMLDNDGDGSADCGDSDCDGEAACHELGAQCTDMLDNDGDGSADCADFDCRADPSCVERCGDGLDNDGDGDVDCDDFDCRTACLEVGNCGDGVDNDGNGLIDCADMDCSCDSICGGAGMPCPTSDLGSAVGPGVASGVIDPMACSAYATTCGGSGDGGEISFIWSAPAAGTYQFDTFDTSGAGGTYDTVLEIRDGGCTGPVLDCSDDDMGALSSVTMTLTSGQVIVIVLDAFASGIGGNYTLNITRL
jgi:hypothetical protein